MPLHPEVAVMLDRLEQVGAPPLAAGTPDAARAGYNAAPKPPGDAMHAVHDREIEGPAGPLPIRVYHPTDEADLPIVAFFHGGGWVLSDLNGHDSLARRLASRSGAIVVSVDYRLAPEHPFPAPHEDCWAATRWLVDHGAEIGGDPSRIAVAGDSAGGNLAAGVALRARDEEIEISFQLLLYPCLDTDITRPSMVDNATGYFLRTSDMVWFWDQYVPPAHRSNPYAVPMRADDLAGLPAALIQTAEFDPLRDEGEAWGERLAAAGVPVTVTRYDGMIHGFAARWDQIPSAAESHDEAGDALKAGLGQ